MCAINNDITDISFAREQMCIFLEEMREKGVELFLDGRVIAPGEAAKAAVCEDSPYMADFVLGEAGNIRQVRFDKVLNC